MQSRACQYALILCWCKTQVIARTPPTPKEPSTPKCTASITPQRLTQRHDGEVFATELAGDGDFLPQGPASLGNHMVCSCRGMMAHLVVKKRHDIDIEVKAFIFQEQRALLFSHSFWPLVNTCSHSERYPKSSRRSSS